MNTIDITKSMVDTQGNALEVGKTYIVTHPEWGKCKLGVTVITLPESTHHTNIRGEIVYKYTNPEPKSYLKKFSEGSYIYFPYWKCTSFELTDDSRPKEELPKVRLNDDGMPLDSDGEEVKVGEIYVVEGVSGSKVVCKVSELSRKGEWVYAIFINRIEDKKGGDFLSTLQVDNTWFVPFIGISSFAKHGPLCDSKGIRLDSEGNSIKRKNEYLVTFYTGEKALVKLICETDNNDKMMAKILKIYSGNNVNIEDSYNVGDMCCFKNSRIKSFDKIERIELAEA